MFRSVAVAALLLSVAACGEESSDSTGAAPTISELTLTPDTITVGTATRLDGQLQFEDADADVRFLAVELRPAVGPAQRLPDVAVQGSAAAGRVDFLLMLQVPAPAEVKIAVWLVDAEENESNTLEAQVVAE